ncbi:MAG TPA: cobalamin-independent methionine synthase II family protein [Acetobacteraceae bacterium]|nr:cobalamin-independent methionine synthase II family protein [Acetobacteraceae bacterium]
MRTSQERILTTHVGSLPRGETLAAMLMGDGAPPGAAAREAEIERRVAHVMERQRAAGIDIANDGEQGRVGFQIYIPERMSGFGGESKRPAPREFAEFPAFAEKVRARLPRRAKIYGAPQAIGPVRYEGTAAIEQEITRLQRHAAAQLPPFAECFMTAPSPGIVATTMLNAWYDSHEAYLMALAHELRAEYEAVVAAGLVLQIDAPDLAMERVVLFQDRSDAEYLRLCEIHVAAVNAALEGLPADRARLHVCWGNWEGPHVHDMPLEPLLPVLYQARVGALSIEMANPRHQHEVEALRRVPPPKDMLILPGVIDSVSNFVEHPEVVARRLEAVVAALGDRERVIASTDCGFGTFAGSDWVTEDVVWAKLQALRAGADIASARLWSRRAS